MLNRDQAESVHMLDHHTISYTANYMTMKGDHGRVCQTFHRLHVGGETWPDAGVDQADGVASPGHVGALDGDEAVVESRGRHRSSASRRSSTSHVNGETPKSFKLSPKQIQDLTNSPRSLPFRAATPIEEEIPSLDKSTDGAPLSPIDGYFQSHRQRETPNDTSPNSQAVSDSLPDR